MRHLWVEVVGVNAQNDSDPGAPGEYPPAAKYVRYVLRDNDPMTKKALVEETGLIPRTVRNALDALIEDDVVAVDIKPGDARQRLYRLRSR